MSLQVGMHSLCVYIILTYFYRVDQVAEEFGLPMGPFKLRDLVGFDVSVAVGGVAEVAYAERVFHSSLLKVFLCISYLLSEWNDIF